MKRNSLLRKKVFERDQGCCAICGIYDAKWEADHIQAISMGGKDALDNMQTLCRRHHLAKSVRETPIRAKADRLRERFELTKRRRTIQGAQ